MAIYKLDSSILESDSLRELRDTILAHFQEIQDYSEIILTTIKDQNPRSDWLLKRIFKKIFPSKL